MANRSVYQPSRKELADEIIRISDEFFANYGDIDGPRPCVNGGTFTKLAPLGWPARDMSLVPRHYRVGRTDAQAWAAMCRDLTGRQVADKNLHARIHVARRAEADKVWNAALTGDDRHLSESKQAHMTGEVVPVMPRWLTLRRWSVRGHCYVETGRQLVWELR